MGAVSVTTGPRAGTLEEAAREAGVRYSTVRVWASALYPSFPDPLDRERQPHLYDLDEIATWRANRPSRRRST